MERIIGISHSNASYAYSISKFFERASYYGFRALIVLYMTGEHLKMSSDDALSVFGLFMSSIIVAQIVGAIIGDFAIGNRKSIILGALLQAIGAFCCYMPSVQEFYVGLFLFVVGSGLYSPNMLSAFGKQYLSKTKLLDAGFSMLYLSVSLGAFIGVWFIGYVGEKYGWNIGFLFSGILILLSIIPVLIAKDPELEEEIKRDQVKDDGLIKILVALFAVGLFWTIYELSGTQVFDMQMSFSDIYASDVPQSWWYSLNMAFLLLIILITIVVWTLFHNSQFAKLAAGFVIGSISLALLLFIPAVPDESYISLFLLSMFLLALAEAFIAPVVNSVLTQYASKKYLTIIMSIAYLPSRLFIFVLGLAGLNGDEVLVNSLLYCTIAMFAVSIGLVIYYLNSRQLPPTTLNSF
jgi:POT family proton-dependent oligopeptide transporter